MRRFYPALALLVALFMVSISVSFLLKRNAVHVAVRLEKAAEQLVGSGDWDAVRSYHAEARAYWNRKHGFFAFSINQSRNSEIIVQWERAHTALKNQERDAFLMENAALAALVRQLVHDFEIKWYNVM